MKVPAFLKNKYVLKFLIFMAIVNVLGYIALEKFNSMALFIVMILLSRYFSKNTSINILIAIIVTSFFTLHNKMREGFKEEEKSTESSTKEKNTNIKEGVTCKKDETMVGGICKKRSGFKNNVPPSKPAAVNNNDEEEVDVAAQMEDAYVNLNKMLGDGAMKSMASETKKLVNQQQDLMNTLHSMTPTLNKAKETLDNLDLPNMEQMTGILKKFTK